MNTKLLAVIPHAQDGTSFYRGIGPLSHMMRHYPVDVTFTDAVDWTHLVGADVVFLQRPFRTDHENIVRMAKMMGRPVWVDWDDWILDVPAENPNQFAYTTEEIRSAIMFIAKHADAVTISTEKLASLFRPICPDQAVRVVPNAMDEGIASRRVQPTANKQIVWRGGAGHARDLAMYGNQLIAVLREHPDWKITFMGWNPWFLTDELHKDQFKIMPGVDIVLYHDLLRGLNPALVIVPLDTGDFARSRSCIAALEGAWAGAAIIAPQSEEWLAPGIMNYRTPDDFADTLRWAIAHEASLGTRSDCTWDWVKGTRLISHTNVARYEIIKGLAR